MARDEPMQISELRAAIKGTIGAAEVFVHLPDGRTLDVASVTYTPANPASFVDETAHLDIWLEDPAPSVGGREEGNER